MDVPQYAMDRTNITDEDEGKKVVSSTGEEIGMVTQVEAGRAHVEPDPGVADTIRSKLGWGDADQEDYVLEEQHIHTITDDEIRISD